MDTHVGKPVASRRSAPNCGCRSKGKKERKCDLRSEERRGKHVRSVSEEKDNVNRGGPPDLVLVVRLRAVPIKVRAGRTRISSAGRRSAS